jgi:ribosomal protein L37AE/L43A
MAIGMYNDSATPCYVCGKDAFKRHDRKFPLCTGCSKRFPLASYAVPK